MGSPAFKAGVRGVPSQAGSIPVHLREERSDERRATHRIARDSEGTRRRRVPVEPHVSMRDVLVDYRSRVGVPAVIAATTDARTLLEIDVVGDRARSGAGGHATVDDQWHIGSCGKSITAALYGRLVEAGLAAWRTPVADLFPDVDGIDAGWSEPTIDDVLHCRAGIPANPSPLEMRRLFQCEDPMTDQRTRAAADVLHSPPKRPGRFVYSNLGYAIVGAAIDRLAGEPFEAALARHVWEPLGITSAGLGPPPDVAGHRPRLRLGPLVAGRGRPAREGGRGVADNPPLLTPAGRFHLTVADWARFVRVFMHDEFLSSKTIDRLLELPPDGRGMAMGWADGDRLGVSHAMQGSNTMWAATALLDRDVGLASMVVINDGRTRVLATSAQLAGVVLDRARR